MKRETVEIEGKTYFVAKPGAKEEFEAKLQQTKIFNKALENDACLNSQLMKVLKRRNIWDDRDQEEADEMQEKIRNNLSKLDEGGFEIMEARKLALETVRLRLAYLSKVSVLREHRSFTAEGQADDAYFDSLVSSCCFDEEGNRVFKSYEDYIAKSKEEYARKLAEKLSSMLYGDTNYMNELPENKFLKEFNFMNDQFELVDEDGNLVDDDYKPIKDEEEEKPQRKPFLKDGQPIE